jgi:hypothetical protein
MQTLSNINVCSDDNHAKTASHHKNTCKYFHPDVFGSEHIRQNAPNTDKGDRLGMTAGCEP